MHSTKYEKLDYRSILVFKSIQVFPRWQTNSLGVTNEKAPDFHGCTLPFFIYAQNIMVYNLTAHNFVSLKDNPNKVYQIKGNWMYYKKNVK